MHDDTSATSRDPETVMAIALSEAGVCPIDPDLAPLPATFAAEVPDPDETPHAATASTCAAMAIFAGTPGRDEFDTRDVWDRDDATSALSETIRILVNGVTIEGTQLFDEREPVLWGFTNMLHQQLQRLERTGHATEAVAAVYTQLARIDTAARHRDAADLEAHLNAIIDWNDTDGRSYEDVRELTAAALRRLDARRR